MTLLKRKIRPAFAMPLAALLAVVAALVAAASLAPPGPTDAQSGNIRYVTAGDLSHCGPGADNPPPNPDQVINGGHFALFDVYWDNSDDAGSGKTLNNNLCPPTVAESTATSGGGFTGQPLVTTNTHTRAASNVNTLETLFHVPTGNRENLAATTTTDTEGKPIFGADKYGFLGAAGDEVWIISAEDKDHLNPGFSTALLPDDFLRAGTKVEFVLEAVRVPGETVDDRGVIFMFDNADGDNSTEHEVKWRSDDVDDDIIEVGVGNNSVPRYQHYHWAFTKPGTYRVQVHAKAHPAAQYLASATVANPAVTSEVRFYTIQVGELADLGVTVGANDVTPATGGSVTLTYTATNDGPDAAGAVKVKAPLPDGLTYTSHKPATANYSSTTGEWTVGAMANGATATLTVSATADSGVAGDTLTATAYIRDTGANPDLDAIVGNNHAALSLHPGGPVNSAPEFRVVRSVAENVSSGTQVGDPVAATDPDSDDTLTYSLSGPHSDQFTVNDQGQIAVSVCATLDYEAHAVYPLTLSVSDGRDSAGGTDTAIDASIDVSIRLTDVVDEAADANTATLVLQPDRQTLPVGQTVTLTAVGSHLPSCSLNDPNNYYYYWRESTDNQTWHEVTAFQGLSTATFTYNTAGERRYRVDVFGAGGASSQIHRITWQAASP